MSSSASQESTSQGFFGTLLARGPEIGVSIGVVAILALLIIPLPSLLLDVLLAMSIALSVTVLLVTLYTTNPLDFSSFPGILLILTLFRLALNVSSTRLILGEADAGAVIEAFGEFVVKGNYVIGFIIFLILVIINFVVITKGAGRIAEVAARFTLDAMPGRQMAIDADLNAGIIDEVEAKRRREEITRTADFYGAMDGASKFVKGDAIAGLLITGINLLAGFVIGVAQRGLSLSESLATYTILTVGDGLVSQIPALIISTASAVIVTQAAGSTHMGAAIFEQMTKHPRALWMAAGVSGVFALIPGLPTIPFLVMAMGMGGMAQAVAKRVREATSATSDPVRSSRAGAGSAPASAPDMPSPEQQAQDMLHVNPLELEVGYALIPLADRKAGGDLVDRIATMRKQIALEVGILIPPVRIRDNIALPPTTYAIKLRGIEVARGEVLPSRLMALDTGDVLEMVDGMHTTDPSYDLPAVWISEEQRVTAEANGYTVVEAPTVLATHLQTTIKQHAADLLGRQEVQNMIDALKQSYPALVQDVVPNRLPLGTLHRVLQRLLREGIPIRDMVTILEAVSDVVDQTKDPEAITEYARRSLTKVIATLYDDGEGKIRGLVVGPQLEAALMRLFSPRAGAQSGMIDPDMLSDLLKRLESLCVNHRTGSGFLPLITPPTLRVGVRRLVEPVLPTLPIVSLAEIPSHMVIDAVATWELPAA